MRWHHMGLCAFLLARSTAHAHGAGSENNAPLTRVIPADRICRVLESSLGQTPGSCTGMQCRVTAFILVRSEKATR